MSKKRDLVKRSHVNRSRDEQNQYTRAIMVSDAQPTVPNSQNSQSTLDASTPDATDDRFEYAPKTRKNKRNRLFLHLRDNWLKYVLGVIGSAVVSMLVFVFYTVNIKITEINKDISYQAKTLDENAESVKQISAEVSSLRATVQSLNDRFDLFIKILKNDNKQ